jgi:hypothetical protein
MANAYLISIEGTKNPDDDKIDFRLTYTMEGSPGEIKVVVYQDMSPDTDMKAYAEADVTNTDSPVFY